MSEAGDILKKYGLESSAILQQVLSEAMGSQQKMMQMQIEQAEKQAFDQENRDNLGDAIRDTFNRGAMHLLNWQKVVNSQEENKYRTELGLPEEQDFIAEQAAANLQSDPFAGVDYKTMEDEMNDYEQEAKNFDQNPDQETDIISELPVKPVDPNQSDKSEEPK